MTDPISGEMASQAVQNIAEVGEVEEAEPSKNFADTMNAESDGADAVDGVDPEFEVDAVDEVDAVEAPSEIPTDDFIQGLLQEEDKIQAMMERCLNGEGLDQQEMLQMQAVIYSYSQRVDLTTKIVESATGGIKQVMNTQV